MKYVLAIVMMLALVVPAFAGDKFELEITKGIGTYAYSESGNMDFAGTRGGIAVAGSIQHNDATAFTSNCSGCRSLSATETNNYSMTGALVIGHGVAGGTNGGYSAAEAFNYKTFSLEIKRSGHNN